MRIEQSKIKNIGIIRGSAIGDIIAYTPILRNLRKIFPKGRICLITGNLAGTKFLSNCSYIDEIISINPKSSLREKFLFFKKLISLHLDMIIDAHPVKNTLMLCLLSMAKYRVTFRNSKFSKYYNVKSSEYFTSNDVVLENLKILNPLNDKNIKFETNLEIFLDFKSKNVINNLNNLLKVSNIKKNEKVIVIHIGGMERSIEKGRNHRCWLNENWVELCRKILKKYDLKIIFIGGQDNLADSSKIIEEISHKNVINLVTKLSLQESTALIKKCCLFICTDSGPMHIAVTLRKRVIALLSKLTWKIDAYITDPIRKEDVLKINVDEVFRKVESVLKK